MPFPLSSTVFTVNRVSCVSVHVTSCTWSVVLVHSDTGGLQHSHFIDLVHSESNPFPLLMRNLMRHTGNYYDFTFTNHFCIYAIQVYPYMGNNFVSYPFKERFIQVILYHHTSECYKENINTFNVYKFNAYHFASIKFNSAKLCLCHSVMFVHIISSFHSGYTLIYTAILLMFTCLVFRVLKV